MIKEILSQKAKIVDEEIRKLIGEGNEPGELYELIEYHLISGGKRVRPALCMAACEAVGSNEEKALPFAAALELLHAFTLVHDDIMDRDVLRRDKETLWKKYGDALAINAGDGIYTKAFESALSLDVEPGMCMKVLKEFTSAILKVCEGQALDVSFETKKDIDLEDYLDMSKRKTGALIGVSTKAGAMIGGGTEEQVSALESYGKKIGLAFQIWDDYIDFASEKTGKDVGSDIKRGKKTSIVCHALKNADAEKRGRLIEILETDKEETTDEMVQEAVEILNESGSIEYGKDLAKKLVDEAKESLDVLDDSEAKKFLVDFAEFVVSRDT